MDLATIIGLIITFGLVLWAIVMGGPLIAFIDMPSVLIVFGGTVGCTLIHYPFKEIASALNVGKKTILFKEQPITTFSTLLVGLANKARKEGILSLQSAINTVEDDFLKKAILMAVDGQEPGVVRDMLNTELEYIQMRHEQGAAIFGTLASYSPAMGMIGTLIGLVQMLQNMSDPSAIGPAMAVALITTFYGAVIANVICLPMAGKLKGRSASEVLAKTLIIEGMQSILSGENPRIMEQKLHAFIAPKLRASIFNK